MTKNNSMQTEELLSCKARVLREVLQTPAFREIIRIQVAPDGPDTAKELVRTALWADPNFSLSLATESPALVNGVIEGAVELGRQLQQFPPELFAGFAKQIIDQIDTGKIADIPTAWGPVLSRILADNPTLADGAVAGQIANTVLSNANKAMGENPTFVRAFFDTISMAQVMRFLWTLGKAIAVSLIKRPVHWFQRNG
jgi:hypothetical protein